MDYLNILFRTILSYSILVLSLRIMGKRQLGELDVGELVSTLLISEIASLPIGAAFEYLTKWYIFELDENGCFSTIKRRRHHICIPTPHLDAYHRETGVS